MSAPKDKGAQQQVFIKILEDLLKMPENKECADCGTKAPRWSSTNLGVFVCIRCSGIHRSLGTHISKVKSVSLDKWTQDQVDVMKSMGNARAKEVYEAYVPDGYPRTSPASDNFALEQWIRDKYERKEFMKRDGADHAPAPRKEKDHKREHREERDNRDNRDNRDHVKPAAPQPRVNTTKPPPVVVPAPVPAPVAAPPSHDLLNFDEPQPQPAPASPPSDAFGDFTSATSGSTKDKNSIMQLYNTPLAPAGHAAYPGMPYGGSMMPPMPYPGPNNNMYVNMTMPPMPGVPPNYYMAAGRGMGVPPGPNYNVHLSAPVGYGGNLPPNFFQPSAGPAYGAYTHAPPPVGIAYTPNLQPATGNNRTNGLNNLNVRM